MVNECNRCGACCERGGDCALRPKANLSRWFIDRCELLSPTDCTILAGMGDQERSRWIDGLCDFPTEMRDG